MSAIDRKRCHVALLTHEKNVFEKHPGFQPAILPSDVPDRHRPAEALRGTLLPDPRKNRNHILNALDGSEIGNVYEDGLIVAAQNV